MRYGAIPLRADGSERMGTEGVLTGDYASPDNFIRYRVRPYGTPGTTYHILNGLGISARVLFTFTLDREG
jgi:hypothetical protein